MAAGMIALRSRPSSPFAHRSGATRNTMLHPGGEAGLVRSHHARAECPQRPPNHVAPLAGSLSVNSGLAAMTA